MWRWGWRRSRFVLNPTSDGSNPCVVQYIPGEDVLLLQFSLPFALFSSMYSTDKLFSEEIIESSDLIDEVEEERVKGGRAR